MNSLKNITLPQALVILGMLGAYFAAHYLLGPNAGHITAAVDMLLAYMMNSSGPVLPPETPK